jgi:hypothetical protein
MVIFFLFSAAYAFGFFSLYLYSGCEDYMGFCVSRIPTVFDTGKAGR